MLPFFVRFGDLFTLFKGSKGCNNKYLIVCLFFLITCRLVDIVAHSVWLYSLSRGELYWGIKTKYKLYAKSCLLNLIHLICVALEGPNILMCCTWRIRTYLLSGEILQMWQNQIRMSRPSIILKLDRFVNIG